MPVNNRLSDDWSRITLDTKNPEEIDILFDGEVCGYMLINLDKNINKKAFFKQHDEQQELTELMSTVPDNYRFNYYYLDYLKLNANMRGKGYGGIILSKWYATLKPPAMVGVLPTRIANVSRDSLVKFYARCGFKMMRERGGAYFGITFIKSK